MISTAMIIWAGSVQSVYILLTPSVTICGVGLLPGERATQGLSTMGPAIIDGRER